MNADERYLIAIDLDDTVLNDLFSLDVKSVWSLINAQEAGHIVMIATARPSCITLPYYRLLSMNTLMSVMCGSYMYHPDDPAVPVFRHTIDAETVGTLTARMRELGMQHMWLEADNDLYSEDGVYPNHPYWRLLFRESTKHIGSPVPAVECGRIFAQTDSWEDAETLKAFCDANPAIRTSIYKTQSGSVHVHIFSSSADKWYSVKEAAEYYNIKPENIITFGDQGIDRMMTTEAAHGFVMCNGDKQMIEAAHASGRGVTEYPCGQGGVGFEIDRLLGL